jgi:hypothetical protein
MPSIMSAIALGAILALGASRALFLGWWTLLPWGIAGLALGYWTRRGEVVIGGALYGFVLSFVFMAAGYSGSASFISRVPFFALLGVFGALCGVLLTAVGSLLRTRFARSVRSRARSPDTGDSV